MVAPARAIARAPAPAVEDEGAPTLRELVRQLEEPRPARRRSAVRQLAELDARDAWLAVLPALADAEAEVADEAQFRLAGASDPKVTDALRGRAGLSHGAPLVRRRAAELLGRRAGGAAAPWLLDAARDKDPEVRRLALWSLERVVAAGAVHPLDERGERDARVALLTLADRDRDARVRGAALFALAAWASAGRAVPELAGALASAAVDDAPELRAAAAALLAEHAPERAGSLLALLAADGVLGVRRAAVPGLVERGDRAAALALVERLEREPSLRLRHRVAEAVATLSGYKPGLDPRIFRDWVGRLPADWSADRSAPPPTAVPAGSSSALYGLPILSDAFAVLIDMSGSMWTAKDGVVPKSLVDVELARVIGSLAPTTRFNLLPYATEPDRMWERLGPATPKNVEHAVAWFTEHRLAGRGNVWDAIELALNDPDVDTLVLFTDGAPTGGPHWNMHLLVPLLLERNRYRNVVFDVVLTGSASNQRLWRSLAESTGGLSTAVKS